MSKYILFFDEISLKDVPQVGGKNASLGEMIRNLEKEGIRVPFGFATTADAYFYFLEKGKIKNKIKKILEKINYDNFEDLQKKTKRIREIILKTPLPQDLRKEILKAYEKLSSIYKKEAVDVAVRSSATAEDLPGFSFAGQQETYLNIKGKRALIEAVKKCFASLFTARATSYRQKGGFDHLKIALSCGIQKMVRSDLACAGVGFSIDTETGFSDVILINGSWGLGEMVVQGKVIPDEFLVFKKTLNEYRPIIKKALGEKKIKLVYTQKPVSGKSTTQIKTSLKERRSFVLSDDEVIELAKMILKIEEHYSKVYQRYTPMDVEWAKDGKDKKLYILQARPETVHQKKEKKYFEEYKLLKKGKVLLEGVSIGQKIGQGKVRLIKDLKDLGKFKKGEVLVTRMTNPDMEPIMKIAGGIITDEGGRTCHAAIISREHGIPCIVGTKKATQVLKDGKEVTLDCTQGEKGYVLEGILPFKKFLHEIEKIPQTKTKVCLNIGSPEIAFKSAFLPADGVGLAREEFIFASEIKVHPLALLHPEKVDRKTKKLIDKITAGFSSKKDYFVEKLAQGIGRIASAFFPKEVIVRFSDFKSNEYRELIGGKFFEPEEANPMIGFRGASRYFSEIFKEAFLLEIEAIKKVKKDYGLKNISVMIPFCRTPEEGKEVKKIIQSAGLKETKIYVMCEIPSNVVLADEFLEIFDGFSIGSNDLTQLTLGIDRDNPLLVGIGDERNPAVKKLISEAIKKCKEKKKYSGICGDAPSSFPEYCEFLVKEGIKAISVTPDAFFRAKLIVSQVEKKIKK